MATTDFGKPFVTAEWRYLAMLNYEIDPASLQTYVPRGTELDAWNGRTFISMVGFLFENTRVMGMAIPFHQNFEEIHLRFYARRMVEDGWRRGVVFIKELVTEGTPSHFIEGSEAEFIAQHYRGYSKQRNGGTMEYRVDHPVWRIWQAQSARLECDGGALYGAGFAQAMVSKPSSAFLAEGSETTVYRRKKIA